MDPSKAPLSAPAFRSSVSLFQVPWGFRPFPESTREGIIMGRHLSPSPEPKDLEGRGLAAQLPTASIWTSSRHPLHR